MPRYPRLADAAVGLSPQVYTSLLALARESGREVFALNVGDTYLEPPHSGSVDGLAEARFPGMHRYADVRGEPLLLDAIVQDMARRGRPVAREHIQVTAGGTSGLDLVARTLLKPGEEVLLLAPYWPLIRGIICASGAVPVEVPFFTELRRHGFDLEAALDAALTSRTSAIYVNSPNNPTGVVLDDGEVDRLARFAHEHGLWVISDEAYERLNYGPERPLLWQHPLLRDRAVVMHTFSKSYGLAGARVAYVHGPANFVEALAGLQTFTTYCAPRPMQIAASRVLTSGEGEAFVSAARGAYRDAAERTARVLGISPPESGTFAFFDTRPFLRPRESARDLLDRAARAGVVLTPGSAAGGSYAEWARLCFTCVDASTLDRALAALRTVLYD
jgi:N-succinyldiaminopimelate aminotransferase